MSTAGGPKLYGIGRGGDSDIVLCMDAHDAGSYPGEPTTNVNTFTLSDSASSPTSINFTFPCSNNKGIN